MNRRRTGGVTSSSSSSPSFLGDGSSLGRRFRRSRARGNANRIETKISAFFLKSREEKLVEQYLNSKEGHEAILAAKRAGKSKRELLKMHKNDIVSLYHSNNERVDLKLPFHVISKPQRLVFASFLNTVIDLPILNEATEQFIFLKVVDVISDGIERQLEKIGSKLFFENVGDLSEKGMDAFVKKTATEINKKIDVPVLNEEQEQEAIEYILHGTFFKVLASKGMKKPLNKKMFGII